jgi:hypothetical protein
LTAGVPIRELLAVGALAAAGVGGALAGLGARGADEAFLLRQQNPVRVTPPAVERLMLTAPDPEPPHRETATGARCRAEGGRELRNPWHCTVRYPAGRRVRFEVTLKIDGSYVADYVDDPGNATATGCCLRVPAAD